MSRYVPDGISKLILRVLPQTTIDSNQLVRLRILASNGIFVQCGFPDSITARALYPIVVDAPTPSFVTYTTSGSISPSDSFYYYGSVGTGCSLNGHCSGHGKCDYCSNECVCDEGYGSSTDIQTTAGAAGKTCHESMYYITN